MVDDPADASGTDAPAGVRAGSGGPARAADDDVLAELRRVAALPGGDPLGVPFYDAHRDPSSLGATRVVQRFGTWQQACRAAGVGARRPVRDYRRAWTDEELRGWVADFVAEAGVAQASYARFGAWLKERRSEGAPSAQTVRNRLGPWSEVLRGTVGG